jgi:hypothetical protein
MRHGQLNIRLTRPADNQRRIAQREIGGDTATRVRLVLDAQNVEDVGVHGSLTVVCPGMVMLMTPAHMQLHLLLLLSAGMLPICTVGEPGDQGIIVIGMHGCGVSTPIAADVAAATCGLASELHMPNGAILTFG